MCQIAGSPWNPRSSASNVSPSGLAVRLLTSSDHFDREGNHGAKRPTIRATQTKISVRTKRDGAVSGAVTQHQHAGRQAVYAGGGSVGGGQKQGVGSDQNGRSVLLRSRRRHQRERKRTTGTDANGGRECQRRAEHQNLHGAIGRYPVEDQ